MNQRLSERLQIVFDNLNPKQDVWDFCCDHGYLGGAAYKSQIFSNIYFVDQVDSIIKKLKTRFDQFVLCENNPSRSYFLCQSAESLNQAITGTISITGVGGLTIYTILSQLSLKKNLKAERIILGPHRDNEKLLMLISDNENLKQYSLQKKIAVVEDGRIRDIYIFDLNCVTTV